MEDWEFKVKTAKVVTETDSEENTKEKYQYALELLQDSDVTMTIKTLEKVDALVPGSTIKVRPGQTQTTLADAPGKDGGKK